MISKNTFVKGRIGDFDNATAPPDGYVEAHNLTLVGDGKFLSLQNIAGTQEIGTIVSSFTGDSYVLAVYGGKWKLDFAPAQNCLTVFTAKPSGNFTIWVYDLDFNVLHKVYEEAFTSAFEAANPVVDAVGYAENGIEYIYFTDGYNEMRKLRCEFNTPYVLFSAQELSLQRRGVLGTLTLSSVAAGGTLLTGTYQFSVRLYNSSTKTYSKWTLLGTPAVVTNNNSSFAGNGQYGLASDKKITLTLSLVNSETAYWTHYQIAAVENIGSTQPITASYKALASLTGGSVGGSFTTYSVEYKSNDKAGDISLGDITVDLAAIDYLKTLQIKNNRMFGGNVTYVDLSYDRTPTVTGSVTTNTNAGTSNTDLSNYRGYFRDEVYRFYYVYWDDNYNLSRPKKIDMTPISGATSNGDYRFPARNGVYTTMNGNNYINIGLSMTVTNHPANARGFAVFRAKRKKKKLFQTPLVPMAEIEGCAALGGYPNTAYEDNGDAASAGTLKTYESATPMNPVGTLVPKNLFHTDTYHIKQRPVAAGGGGDLNVKGEVKYQTTNAFKVNYSAVFEPGYQFRGDAYTPSNSDSINVVDFAFTKLDYTRSDSSSSQICDTIDTSVHGTFHSANDADYFHTYNTSPAYPSVNGPDLGAVLGYKQLDNYGEGTTLSGEYVGQFSNLQTGGINWGVPPSNQRMSIIQHSPIEDFARSANTIKAASIDTSLITNSLASPSTAENKTSIDTHPSFSENVSYVNCVPIVDIENDLSNDRYGADDAIHELVFTGAHYVFSDSERTTVQSSGAVPIALSVYGGDCYVSLHNFKLTDSHYGISNNGKQKGSTSDTGASVKNRWDRYFLNGAATPSPVCMPVPYKNLSQVLSVVLESEYLGEAQPPYPYSAVVSGPSHQVPTSTEEREYRISFPYLYHTGYNRMSDQKVLIPFSSTESLTTKFKARAVYSDQKVYNTDIQGFDVFRSANFVDLEENYGGLTKLTLDGDNLIGIQEAGVAYIPVDAAQIETADAQSLEIRSGTTGIPMYLSRLNGCQHTKAVIKSGDATFFPDNNNQSLLKVSGNAVEVLSDRGNIAYFNSAFATDIGSKNLFGLYDNNRRHYWLFSRTAPFHTIWDDRFQLWVGDYDFSGTNRLYDGVFTNNALYLLGRDSGNNLKVYKMYSGSANSLFGTTVTPSVSFISNPDYDKNKTFDTLIAYSRGMLENADVVVEKESGVTKQEVFAMTFEEDKRDGYFLLPTLRDVNKARLRGTSAKVTLRWPTTGTISLSQCLMNYRISERNG